MNIQIDVQPHDVQRAVDEVRRELGLRSRVYPLWVASGRMTEAAARAHTTSLQDAERILESIRSALSPRLL